jgi:hypothetical protein
MLIIWFRRNKLAHKIVTATSPRIGEGKVTFVQVLKKWKSVASMEKIMSMIS